MSAALTSNFKYDELHELSLSGDSRLAAELLWALNGADIYSGHSVGGSLRIL
jgi:hypothetical protein